VSFSATPQPTPLNPAASDAGKARFAPVGSRFYAVLMALSAVVVVLSNIGAAKGVEIGPLVLDGGFVLFPLAYVLGDVISEVYGWRASRNVVIMSFAMALLAVGSFWVMIRLPQASFYEGQDAFAATLGPVWRIVLASVVGFMAGQLSNSLIRVAMKKRQGERGLVWRLWASTGVGEFLDTFLFCCIAAGVIGVSTVGQFVNYVVVGFVWKTAVELILSPLTALVIGWFKRREPGYFSQVEEPKEPKAS
jgi:uncharacterized integral membrane protein (TIGR00697 family)